MITVMEYIFFLKAKFGTDSHGVLTSSQNVSSASQEQLLEQHQCKQ